MQAVSPASLLAPLEQLINYAPPTVTPETTVWDTVAFMNQSEPPLQCVLVADNWQAVGLFSWKDVLQAVESEINLKSTKITEVMKTSAIKLKFSHFRDIKFILDILNNLKGLPIVIEDEKEKIVGYITPESINNFLLKDYQLKIEEAEHLDKKNKEIRTGLINLKKISKIHDLDTLLYFQEAIGSSSEGIVITDIAGNIIYLNSSFIKIFDYTREELNSKGGLSFLWKDEYQYQELLATIQQGKSWRNEVEIKSRCKDISYINVRTDAVKDVSGQIVGMISVHTNITEEVQAKTGLRLQNKAIDASSNGLAIFDVRLPSKPIVYSNPEFGRVSGDSVSEALGLTNRFVEMINHEINQLLKFESHCSSQNFSSIIRNYCKDGSEYWYQLNMSPIVNRTNKLTHYVCVQSDITKYKLTEMSLLLTQEKLQHLLFSSTGVIYGSDYCEDYGVTFISENILDIVGFRADEILCDSNFWMSHIHPEDLPLFITEIPKVFTQTKVSIEYRFLHKNGNYIWIYEQSKIVKDYADNPLEIVGYRIDITERKQLEEHLKQALENEREVNELKSRFISMTSHEFRTPLSTILSSSELLENYRHKWNEEKQIKHFNRIKKAVKHMNNLLNEVLFFGKAEAGKLDCNPTNFDLVEYSYQLVEDLQINQTKNLIDTPDVKINFTTDKTKLIGYMDEKILGHILNNLLSNAIKYSQPGTTVKFTLSSQKERVIFEIQDRGIGIPSEDLPSLFDSFHRCKNVGNIPGTGLGLSIVKKCVDIQQGEIKVISEVGVGTTFTVIIPLNNCTTDS
ncbi:MAG: PAS domain-containing protein [Cyanobacteria bacterium P01_D01_bin.50]